MHTTFALLCFPLLQGGMNSLPGSFPSWLASGRRARLARSLQNLYTRVEQEASGKTTAAHGKHAKLNNKRNKKKLATHNNNAFYLK